MPVASHPGQAPAHLLRIDGSKRSPSNPTTTHIQSWEGSTWLQLLRKSSWSLEAEQVTIRIAHHCTRHIIRKRYRSRVECRRILSAKGVQGASAFDSQYKLRRRCAVDAGEPCISI